MEKQPETKPEKRGRKPATIDCVALRRFGGIEGHVSSRGFAGMAEVGEEVTLPRARAIELQDAGVIKVAL